MQKESFYTFNRYFLLSAIVLVLFLPLLNLPSFVLHQGFVDNILTEADAYPFDFENRIENEKIGSLEMNNLAKNTPIQIPKLSEIESQGNASLESTSYPLTIGRKGSLLTKQFPYIFYWIVTSLLLLNLTRKIVVTCFKIKNSKYIEKHPGYTIACNRSIPNPSSFFGYIFIDRNRFGEESYQHILAHEIVHVKKLHSIDLVLSEIMISILWLNPLAWFFRRDLVRNIEYETDNAVVKNKPEWKINYQLNLLKITSESNPNLLYANYNQSLIRERIVKLNSKKSASSSILKYLLVIPILMLVLLSMNSPIENHQIEQEEPEMLIAGTDQTQPTDSQANNNKEDIDHVLVLAEEKVAVSASGKEPSTEGRQKALFEEAAILSSKITKEGVYQSDCKNLIRAIYNENLSEVERLIQNVDVNCIDPDPDYEVMTMNGREYRMRNARTPLIAAARLGNFKVVKWLVNAGADIDLYEIGDASPLISASGRGFMEIVEFLIEQGADINKEVVGEGSALIAAAREGRFGIVKYLISKGANINQAVQGSASPIIAASREGHLEIVKHFVALGANIDKDCPGEGNALTVAARSNQIEMVKYLLNKGANVNFTSHGEGSPLTVAVRGSHLEMIELLFENGADVNLVVPGEGSPLTVASRNGNLKIVKYLLAKGANINVQAHGEGTPLSLAARQGLYEVLSYLLDRGADPNVYAHGDLTPLAHAVKIENTDIIKLLLKNNASPDLEPHGGNSASWYAARQMNKDIQALFEDY